jgi:hypothetical protein
LAINDEVVAADVQRDTDEDGHRKGDTRHLISSLRRAAIDSSDPSAQHRRIPHIRPSSFARGSPTILVMLLFLLLAGAGLTLGFFGLIAAVPYWGAERRGRARWRPADEASRALHPYRVVATRGRAEPARAPALVRAAAMTSFVWAWGSLAWALAFALERRADGNASHAAAAIPVLVAAFFAQLAGRRLLARDEGAMRLTRPLVLAQAAHGVLLVMVGAIADAVGVDAMVAHLTAALGIAALVQAAIVYAATRAHGAAFVSAPSRAR